MSKDICVILTNDNEDIEVVAPIDIWRRAGLNVELVSITDSLDIRLAHGNAIKADKLYKDVDIKKYKAVFFPGGMGYKNYFTFPESNNLVEILKNNFLDDEDKYIIAICAAPDFIAKSGLMNGRNATCYPGFEESFEQTYRKDLCVCSHDNLITACGPNYAISLALKTIEEMIGRKKAETIASQILFKYDQKDE